MLRVARYLQGSIEAIEELAEAHGLSGCSTWPGWDPTTEGGGAHGDLGYSHQGDDPMTQAKLTIGELEAGYPLYCKALRRLLQQGKTAKDIERTVCWGHLETLNRCLPTRYKSPSYLLTLIRRDLEKIAAEKA